MKHLKTYEMLDWKTPVLAPDYGFENLDFGKYFYGVHNDNRDFLKKRLEKLVHSNSTIETLLDKSEYYNEGSIFIGVNYQRYSTQYDINSSGNYFIEKGFEYLGPLQLSKQEIEEVQIKKNANKYNL